MNGPFLTSFLALSLLSTPLYAADMTAADVSTANSSSQNKGTLDDSNSDDLSPPAPATIDNNISIIENSETLAQSPAQNPVQRKTSLTELSLLNNLSFLLLISSVSRCMRDGKATSNLISISL